MSQEHSRHADNEGLSALKQLLDALKQAWDNKNWDQIASLDVKIKAEVSRVCSLDLTGEQARSRENLLRLLDKIYDRLISAGENYRQDLAVQLRQINREKKAAFHYQKTQSES